MTVPAGSAMFGANRQAVIKKLTGVGFATPALLALLLLNVVPLVVLAFLSLTDYQFGNIDFSYIGLGNFSHALKDEHFRSSLLHTLIYAAIVVPGSVGLGLLFAILVHGRKESRTFYEVIFFLPVTATLVAMAAVWKFLLHPTLGPVNAVISAIGFEPISFLSEPAYALPTIAVIGIWQLVGFNMILFIAGLSNIPRDLYEAADLDGAAGPIDRFLTVTWPMLGPTTMFVLITTTITAFKVFDSVVAMTRGGPQQATEVILYSIYLEGFQYFQTAYAAALTLVFLAFVLLCSGIQAFSIDKRVHY